MSYRASTAGAALALLAAVSPAASQSFPTENAVLRRIWQLGMDSSQTYPLAQALLDSIGPRLTGSPGQRAAIDWAVARYTAWGIPARAERYGTWRGWRRGATHVDLVATPESYQRMREARTRARDAWAARVRNTGYALQLGTGTLGRRLDEAGAAGVVASRWSLGWGVNKVFDAQNERAPALD